MIHTNYTPEEITAAHDCNENFHGTRANLNKIRLYQVVKRNLVEFMECCDKVDRVDGFDPNVREKHAIIWMDLCPAAILDEEGTAELAGIMAKADGAVFTAVDGHVRITFDIKNIWYD